MSDEEEDYMSMIIEEPTQKETFTQRKRREQREVSFPSPSLLPFLTSSVRAPTLAAGAEPLKHHR